MVARRGREFSASEEELLINNFQHMTIHELETLFKKNGYNRTKKSINRKLEKLRVEGRIDYRNPDTTSRAYNRARSRKKPTKIEEPKFGEDTSSNPSDKGSGKVGWGTSNWEEPSWEEPNWGSDKDEPTK
jgi:hypothetical protein